MGLFDRFQNIQQQFQRLKASGDSPFTVQMQQILSQTEAIIEGRHTILMGTNNYLGLTFDKRCQEASIKAVQESGTGTTGSRIANGSYADHQGLEDDLAKFYDKKYCMVFSTGYQANLGIISTLAGPDDFLLLDADSHASIYDGAKLGSATVIRFRHSMGVLGKTGRGLCQEDGVEADIDFVVGTFSKSLGAVGGFCVSDHPQFEYLRLACRPYMFTASLPPATMASVRMALKIVGQEPALRLRLWQNVEFFYQRLQQLGFRLGTTKSPVVPIYMPDPGTGFRFWQMLLHSGVYANMALPPATPMGTALLRFSICSAHQQDQLQKVVEIVKQVADKISYFTGQPLASMAVA